MILCRIVLRIGHFFSDITLTWSKGQADDPARAFLIIDAISAYEGGIWTRGVAGGGSERNQLGIVKRHLLKESDSDRTLKK